MTTPRTSKTRVAAHLETLADRAVLLSIPFVAAFMAIALIHVG
ncbi:MAG TPA: hypothetical protein VGM25_08885 [Caulobacteraceae bacterium]|jgi:hypothetical protein